MGGWLIMTVVAGKQDYESLGCIVVGGWGKIEGIDGEDDGWHWWQGNIDGKHWKLWKDWGWGHRSGNLFDIANYLWKFESSRIRMDRRIIRRIRDGGDR